MMAAQHICRSCGSTRLETFCDLGMSPFANAYLKPEQLSSMEPFFPLHAYVCESCLLVQLAEFQSPSEIFSDYAYFSSFSESWVEHARLYTETMKRRFGIGAQDLVVEIASNDGYLLQHFAKAGVPVLGVEPAANVAVAAEEVGVPTVVAFFGSRLADELVAQGRRPVLIASNNVLAHVPDLNDFVLGIKRLLAPQGVATFEFPHLARLVEEAQFDTIYHEHFCYFSVLALRPVFERVGLSLFDIEKLPTHGGSLRLFVQHASTGPHRVEPSVEALVAEERAAGLADLETYRRFGEAVREVKRSLLDFLIAAKREGKTVVAYGAAAKGNTLLNYCGVRTDFVDYVVDRSPHKQGRYLPGVHLPIEPVHRIFETRPDYLLILPWNLREEVMSQMASIRQWGGRFVTGIPQAQIFD